MTPVLFHFITPDGVPLANARVDIQLSRSSYDEDHDGVLMPRLVEATTDEDGKVTVELAPADVLYHVECWDTDSEAGLSYKFMVPEQEVPNTPIRLQDIVIVGEMSNTSYDEAALIAIHAAKATALTAAISATASAVAADASADIAAAAVDEINGHMADPTGAHAASAISNTPAGGISATTVQAAINELDTEKARLDGAAFSGAVSAPGFTGPLTGDVIGNASGNAGTATALATPRAINGVNFDGSAAITVTAAAGTLTGTTLAANAVNASLNSITPTGGLLAVTGSQSITGNLGIGYSTFSNAAGASGRKFIVGDAATSVTPAAITVYSGAATYGGVYFADGWTGDQAYRGYVEYNHATDTLSASAAGGAGGWSLSASGFNVTGNVTATGQFTNDNYGLTLNSDGFGYWMGFPGVRAAGIYTDSGTIRIRSENQDLFHLTGSALALTARQTIAVNSASAALTAIQNGSGLALDIQGSADLWYGRVGNATGSNFKFSGTAGTGYALMQSFITDGVTAGGVFRFQRDGGRVIIGGAVDDGATAFHVTGAQKITANAATFALEVDNSNAGGYGVRIRSAGVGGEPPLAVMSANGSTTVAQIKNNGSFFGLSGVFSYGLDLSNNTGVIHFQDTGGTPRRAILRASDQIIFGDVDNSTTDSYLSFCANLTQRHVINNNQVGVWTSGGLAVTGSISATANSSSPALSVTQNGAGLGINTNGDLQFNGNRFIYGVDGSLSAGTVGSNPLIFFTSNTGRARITEGGDFLIGQNTNPSNYKLAVNGNVGVTGGYIAGEEQTAPAAPAANGYRIFAQDNGAGKTQLMVIFATGAAQQIAIEP